MVPVAMRYTGSGHAFGTAKRMASSLVSWTADTERKIGTITLESPATYNALTVEMGHDFQSLIRTIQQDLTSGGQNINAIVLTGAGDKAFSAGGNFDWLMSLKDNSVPGNVDCMLAFYKSFLCIRQLPVPTIAALQGPAVGAGAGLALACDLRVCSEASSKVFGFTFSKLGIHTGMGASHYLPLAMGGPSAVMNEILLTGKFVSGEEAFEFGLVNRLVASTDQVKEESYRLAEEISTQHPLAVRSMVQTIRQQQDVGLEASLQREAHAQALCYNRDDWGEGVKAVMEQRTPMFDNYHDK